MPVGHLKKRNKQYKHLKKQEIHHVFIKTDYIKLVFNMIAYGDFKDLNRKTAADKILPYKTFNIAKNKKNYDGSERGLVLKKLLVKQS